MQGWQMLRAVKATSQLACNATTEKNQKNIFKGQQKHIIATFTRRNKYWTSSGPVVISEGRQYKMNLSERPLITGGQNQAERERVYICN